MLTSLLLSTGLPILLDLIKSAGGAVSRKFLGLSVDDQIKIDTAQVERLKALAELDNPHGVPSQLIVDIRAGFRYVIAALLILGGITLAGYGAFSKDAVLTGMGIELASAPFGFIFGERLVLSYRIGGK